MFFDEKEVFSVFFIRGLLVLVVVSALAEAEVLGPVAELSGTVRWKNNKLDRFVRDVYRLTFDRPGRVFEAAVLTFDGSGSQGDLVLPLAADWRSGDSVSVVVREFKFSAFPEFDFQNPLPLEISAVVESEFANSNMSGRELGRVLLGTDGKFKFRVVMVPIESAGDPFQVMIMPFSKSSPASDVSKDSFINLLIDGPIWKDESATAVKYSSWGRIKKVFRLR